MTKMPAPSDVADKFMLRMPDGMRDRLKQAAETNNRSMNAEIVYRIEASFADAYEKPFTVLADKSADLVARTTALIDLLSEAAQMSLQQDREFFIGSRARGAEESADEFLALPAKSK